METNELKELLIYMVTSAANLAGEPAAYGPLRMIESAQRLAGYLERQTPKDPCLEPLIATIEAGKSSYSTDPEAFAQMLENAVMQLLGDI